MMIDTRTLLWILLGLAILAIVVGVALERRSRRRHLALRERFGPEYDRVVALHGRRADRILSRRAERVEQMKLHELDEATRARFGTRWTSIQAQFVDDPQGAVDRANELIKEVMRARGYSAEKGFEQRAADLSVDHPDVVEHYRAARALAQPGASQGTEELRQAVVHYRVLFADLLEPSPAVTPPAPLTPSPA